jgi:hypothetical protein
VLYHLDCQECDFETRVENGRETLLDEIEAHQDEQGATHFVEFELIDD